MNYNIKINLLKLNKSFVANFKGATETKRCIIIPIEDNELYEGEKSVYLDLVANETLEVGRFSDTHMIKKSVKKEKYDAMTDEERKAIPIFGNLKPLVQKQTAVNVPADSITPADDSAFPF